MLTVDDFKWQIARGGDAKHPMLYGTHHSLYVRVWKGISGWCYDAFRIKGKKSIHIIKANVTNYEPTEDAAKARVVELINQHRDSVATMDLPESLADQLIDETSVTLCMPTTFIPPNPTAKKRRKSRKKPKLLEDEQDTGYELTVEDWAAMKSIQAGQGDASDDSVSWLKECDILDENGALTKFGTALLSPKEDEQEDPESPENHPQTAH
jgi:hypothetical protein